MHISSKRLIALAIAVILAAGLTACGHKQDAPGVNDTPDMQKQRKDKSGD